LYSWPIVNGVAVASKEFSNCDLLLPSETISRQGPIFIVWTLK
jgi:hypothetical protein